MVDPPTRDRLAGRQQLVLAGCVAALAALVYANSLLNGFAYDDIWIVQTRAVVHGLGRIGELLTADYWPDRFGSGLYRPLTMLSLAVDWSVWGGRAIGFHLTNIVLHAAVSAMLTLLLLRFFSAWSAFAGAAVFAVHPVHTEAVANVVGRGELLTALFVLLACLVYLGGSRRDRLSSPRAAAVTVCYALAVLSKEVGVILPALLLLTDLPMLAATGRGRRLRAFIRPRLPLLLALAAVLIAYLGLRWLVLGAPFQSVIDRAFIPDSSFPTRFFTMARVWPRYFQLLLFPLELSADYSPAVILPAAQLTPLGSMGILLVTCAVAAAILAFRRTPELSVAVGWVAVSLLPVSNLIIVAEIVLAERTFYLPSVGVAAIAALVVARARAPLRRWALAGLALWVGGFSLVTLTRNPVWRSTETVFADLQEHHPESSRLLWYLGDRRLRLGDWQKAKEWYRRSLEVWPYFPQYLAEYAVNLNRHGELAEAQETAERAIELKPDYPDYYSLLGLIRYRRGDYQGVLAATSAGLETVGDDPVLYALRADAFAGLGRFQEAALAQERTIRLRSTAARWQDWLKLAQLRAVGGDTVAALAAVDSLRRVAGGETSVADSLTRALGGL